MSALLANPRSKLHALGPIGIGTPEVESLLSYLCRLAVSHSVSIAALSRQIARLVGWEFSEKYDAHFANINLVPVGGTPVEAAAFIKKETAVWGNVIKEAHVVTH